MKRRMEKMCLALLLAAALAFAPAQYACAEADEAQAAPASPSEASVPEAPPANASAPTSPAHAPEATETPAPSETPEAPEPTPEAPAETVPEPSATPDPSASAAPDVTPDASEPPEETQEPCPTPEPTATPEPTLTPLPTLPGFELLSRSDSWSDRHLDPGALKLPADGMPIPLLFQFNYKTPVCRIGDESKSVATSGCGATAASMVIAYIRQDYNQTPYTLFYKAAENGWYRGDGLGYESIRHMLSSYGVDARQTGVSQENVARALRANHPVIIKMDEGTFTNYGHYIVLRGLDESDRVLVNDPNSEGRSGDSYSLGLIVREAKSEHMLVVYTPPKAVPTATPEARETPSPAPAAREVPPATPALAQPNVAAASGEMSVAVDATLAPEMPVAVDTPLG